MRQLREVWQHRELLRLLVATDLKLRYKGSALGFLWGLLNPLLSLGILAFVFTHLFDRGLGGERFNYPLFLLTGLVPWTFFSQGVSRATTAVLEGRTLLRKVALPNALFPLASALSSLVHLLLSLPALVALAVLLGAPAGWGLLYFPVGLLTLTCFLFGVGFAVAALHVFFRDTEHLIGIVLSLAFYLTPVIYPIAAFEGRAPAVAAVLRWNPLTPLIAGVRDPLWQAMAPATPTLVAAWGLAIGTLVAGWWAFARLERRFFFYV